jgi:hypothetical protein
MIQKRGPSNHFTNDEDKIVDQMYRAGARLWEIAMALPGRTKSGVSSRCRLLGLTRNNKRLTRDEEEHLIKLRIEQRMNYDQMAAETGLERDRVRYAIQRLVRAGRIGRDEQRAIHRENTAKRRRAHVA